jgi:hypothetical protein
MRISWELSEGTPTQVGPLKTVGRAGGGRPSADAAFGSATRSARARSGLRCVFVDMDVDVDLAVDIDGDLNVDLVATFDVNGRSSTFRSTSPSRGKSTSTPTST